jgi:hypothetical protein
MDIASTPCGKVGFFYKCSLDERYKKFYVSAEDCPRHEKSFLDNEKGRLSALAYAQEYLAVFTDELRRLFSDELIKEICSLKRSEILTFKSSKYYLGCDIAGLGEDECTFEVLERLPDKRIMHKENIIEKRNLTVDTARRIISLNQKYRFYKIGIDDAGVGFGVYSELMNNDETKRKTLALNNASRPIDKDGEKSKKLLKEEMYFNLLMLMETKKIKLLDDDEIKASLNSIQYEIVIREKEKTKTRIFGSYSHITEGLIRAAWLAEKDKSLNIFIRSF